jgi:hypothetical protein
MLTVAGGSQPHNNMMPSLAMKCVISLYGIFLHIINHKFNYHEKIKIKILVFLLMLSLKLSAQGSDPF